MPVWPWLTGGTHGSRGPHLASCSSLAALSPGRRWERSRGREASGLRRMQEVQPTSLASVQGTLTLAPLATSLRSLVTSPLHATSSRDLRPKKRLPMVGGEGRGFAWSGVAGGARLVGEEMGNLVGEGPLIWPVGWDPLMHVLTLLPWMRCCH